MKQDKINFDTTTIEDNHLNTEDILERYKEISNSIADAASAISPVFSEQLNEFISKINASEYFKNYEEALKPLTESLIKSFAYSEQMSNTLSQFAKYIEQSKPQNIELFSCLIERVSKLQEITDIANINENEYLSNDAEILANQIVDELNEVTITDSNNQISLPIEKKDKWTYKEIIELIAAFVTIIDAIFNFTQSQQPNIEINNTYNIQNVNISNCELSNNSQDNLEYVLDDNNQQNKD